MTENCKKDLYRFSFRIAILNTTEFSPTLNLHQLHTILKDGIPYQGLWLLFSLIHKINHIPNTNPYLIFDLSKLSRYCSSLGVMAAMAPGLNGLHKPCFGTSFLNGVRPDSRHTAM
jgi:hypothetical protein